MTFPEILHEIRKYPNQAVETELAYHADVYLYIDSAERYVKSIANPKRDSKALGYRSACGSILRHMKMEGFIPPITIKKTLLEMVKKFEQ